jgi:SP family sugar:H+ symporter-like MFS transporter
LGARIGFLWGGFSVVATLWTFFYLPETGFRALEELDELFFKNVGVRQFKKYQTAGFGAQLSAVEQGPTDKAGTKVVVTDEGDA